MSLVSLLGSASQTGPSSNAKTVPPGQEKKSAETMPAPAPEPAPGSGGSGSAAPAETTQTATRVPPPTASRATNASATLRPGGDGGDATARALGALTDAERLDAAFSTDLDEARARRYAEAEQDRLITQEILSRIPVPLEALPRLNLEAQRAAEETAEKQERPARVA